VKGGRFAAALHEKQMGMARGGEPCPEV
jgi:hypothetical protein